MNLSKLYKSNTKNSQAGFSLVEAMAAIAIFAIGILGVYKMQIHAIQSNALASRISSATSYASYAIEEILGKPYDHEDLQDDDGPGNSADGWAGLDNGLNNDGEDADGQLYVRANGTILATPSASGDDAYSIFYNIVEGGHSDADELEGTETNKLLRDSKLIRVHVIRNFKEKEYHLYSHDYYKYEWPSSPSPPT